jgi:hypothetical protein
VVRLGAVDGGDVSSEGVQGGVDLVQRALSAGGSGGDHDFEGRRGHGSVVLEEVGFGVVGCRVLGTFA